MEIERIKLTNFRQFYGSQELEIAEAGERNVTLIHAENGAGKTTILNSVLWAMYGSDQLTPRFEQRDDIVCRAALAEGARSANVEVFMTNDGSDYVVKRHTSNSGDSLDGDLRVGAREEDGNYRAIRSPGVFVESIIPSDIAKYFFFDGEAAESFSSEGNSAAVHRAIRNILGCGLMETAIGDLKSVRASISREMGKLPGSQEADDAEHQRVSLELQVTQAEILIEEFTKERDRLDGVLEEIEERLRASAAAKELQLRRDRINRDLKQARTDYAAAKAKSADWLADYGTSVVGRSLASMTLDFVEEQTTKGVIPSPYNEELIQELLKDQTCLCGRPLHQGSPEYTAILEKAKDGANETIRRRLRRAESFITRIDARRSDAVSSLTVRITDRDQCSDRVNTLEGELSEVTGDIEKIDLEQIKAYETEHKAVRTELRNVENDLRRNEFERAENKKKMEEFERRRDNFLKQSKAHEGLRMRRDLADAAITQMETELTEYEADARRRILKKVNDILDEFLKKDFSAGWGTGFALQLKTKEGKTIGKSTGENQLLSLAFISALVWFSKLRSGASGSKLSPGTIAPLILDAPFGQLDDDYKEATAKFIPELADQVVVLVTKAQGSEMVLNAIEDRIGAEYIFIRENTDPRGRRPVNKRVIQGIEYEYTKYECEREMARIERIR